ncbi:MAG: hydroxymethylbilane synthase [Deltaproteobacteria bacterium]
MKIRLGTRPSRLARVQAREIAARWPQCRFDPVFIETPGDRDKETPLGGREGGDFFTRDLEEALRRGVIDAAVHSAKDVEDEPPEDLVLAALTPSISPFECLIAAGPYTLGSLPKGAVVGTSSRRRRDAVARLRPDVVIKDIRGNIEERLAQLDKGAFDAFVSAHAAFLRLGLTHRISELFPLDVMEPHPLQGRLCIQVRRDRKDLIRFFGEQ